MAEFDWQGAYARLDRARRALEVAGDLPREEVRRILAARAQALARPREEAQAPADFLDLLVFSLGGERYAIETAYVQEVVPLRALTPVPCTPTFVLGVVNHRGQILPVLDLRRLVGVAGGEAPKDGRVVAVEAGGMAFGIFADAEEGTTSVRTQEILPSPVAVSAEHQVMLRGVTSEMIAVLDLERIASEKKIIVQEQVGA